MHTCKPNCETYEKKIETIQYRGSHPDNYVHIRRKHKLGDETEFFKAEIEISKEPYVISFVNSQARIVHDPRSRKWVTVLSKKDNKNTVEIKNLHFLLF
ncbi:unnamed protein product, partial [Oikopleura dioica]